MKKGLALFIASIVISSFVFAEELDDQIQRLEKETKLLELQKKEQKLQVYKEGTNTNVGSGLKNGIFLGIEGQLGANRLDVNNRNRTEPIDNISNNSSTTFDLGLMGGYQYYFGESQKHGIRASAHIYSGFGNSWEWNEKYFSLIGDIETFTHNVSYIPIKFGFDVSYLWDFLERNGHVLGLNAGLSWEFDWYINGKIVSDHRQSNIFRLGVAEELAHNEEKLSAIFAHGLNPTIGLHYYYKNHQFQIMCRVGEISGTLSTNFMSFRAGTIKYGTNYSVRGTIRNDPLLTFSYAYRF